jgi:hypothetical protein
LTAGIETRNGHLYRPIQKTVQVTETGETTVRVEIQVPPSVRAKFVQRDQTKTRALITAYQGDKEVFRFRSKDEVYVDEGTCEFRAKPNPENELTVTETFADDDHKETVFEMVHTVRARFKLVASGSQTWFRQNYELWQAGEKKYGVHANNGALVVPGTYDLHMQDPLTPFVKENVVITQEEEQDFEIVVPAGHVTVVYLKADGTRDDDERCFIGPGPTGSGKYKLTGQRHPLVPGVYNVAGWRYKGEYDTVVFEIEQGKDIEVVLQAKK